MGTLNNMYGTYDLQDKVLRLVALGRLDDGVVLRNPPTFDWNPDESERAAILLEIADFALGTADNCGANSEEATEAREFYFSVRDKQLSEAKEEIQRFFFETYEAVLGDINEYYGAYPELRRLICLTLGIKGA